jgi:S-adenosylmethionine:tRNA ribosyltransferase-isomerase
MKTDAFDFELPPERIALHPAEPRESARLLEIAPDGLADQIVVDLPEMLRPGDVLVFNDTRVIPAALSGTRRRGDAEARIEANLHKRVDANCWRAFVRPARKLTVGERVRFGGDGAMCLAGTLDATVTEKGEGGEVVLAFDFAGPDLDAAIAAVGRMPLPRYIAQRRPVTQADAASYQTVYARNDGAVAAPTAGLHFTDNLLARLEDAGVGLCFLTLHIGAGTFLPVKVDDIEDHAMHAEWGEVTKANADRLNAVRGAGGRIIAVGTTVTRLLETAAGPDRRIRPFTGETDIFIHPGYTFRGIDAMLTNFHLPRSTLFMLVSALAGLERMQSAYAHAIQSGYRFYSYGDATLIWPTAEAVSS